MGIAHEYTKDTILVLGEDATNIRLENNAIIARYENYKYLGINLYKGGRDAAEIKC